MVNGTIGGDSKIGMPIHEVIRVPLVAESSVMWDTMAHSDNGTGAGTSIPVPAGDENWILVFMLTHSSEFADLPDMTILDGVTMTIGASGLTFSLDIWQAPRSALGSTIEMTM